MSSSAPSLPSASAPSAVKRSSRLHAASSKRSNRAILDLDARRHVMAARVAALEADNQVEQAEDEYTAADDSDDDEQVLAGAAGAKAKGAKGGKGKAATGGVGGKRRGRGAAAGGVEAESADGAGKAGKRRARVSLLALVDKLGMRDEGAVEPNYVTAASSPPNHPPRSFCSVCGYLSCYTCVRCGMRYCTIACQRTHNDTTCLKVGT